MHPLTADAVKQSFSERRPDDIAEAIIYFLQTEQSMDLPGATHRVHEAFAQLKESPKFKELLSEYHFRRRPVTRRSELLATVIDDFQRTYSTEKPNPDMKVVKLTKRGKEAINVRMQSVLTGEEVDLCHEAASVLKGLLA
jgi:hypothetical protein